MMVARLPIPPFLRILGVGVGVGLELLPRLKLLLLLGMGVLECELWLG